MNLQDVLNIWPLVITVAVIILLTLFILLTFFWMGPEGRYHWSRGKSGGGIDLLSYDPMSKTVSPAKMRWDGKNWRSGEKGEVGIWLRLQTLANPKTSPEKQFNDALSMSTHWGGCHRPLLLATDEAGITLNFQTAATITKSGEALSDTHVNELRAQIDAATDAGDNKRVDELTVTLHEAEKSLKGKADPSELLKTLQDMGGAGITMLRVIQPINPSDLETYIQSASPMELDDAHEAGKAEGIKLMTQPPKPGLGLGGLWKWIIVAGIVIILGVGVFWLINSGTLQKILPGG